jgi:cell division protein ZapA (FtsZ GTPase activity inhibitor)
MAKNLKLPFTNLETLVFVIYVAFLITYKIDIPAYIANIVDTLYGNVLVILAFGTFYMSVNPIVGIVGLLVAYELIRRSSNSARIENVIKETQSESQKMQDMKEMNKDQQTNNPPTLEEEIGRAHV